MHLLALFLEFLRSNPATVALVGGFITPLIVSVLQQPQLTKLQRTAVSVAASVVLGGAAAYSTGLFDDASDLVTVIVLLYTVSETCYQKLWKATGLPQAIEQATTLGSAKPEPAPVAASEDSHERE